MSNDIERRWVEHKSPKSIKKTTVLARAFRKYGIDNFFFLNVNSSGITKVIKGEQKTCKGYGWIRSVETSRDECSGVGGEMSYPSKCEAALNRVEDIVHASGWKTEDDMIKDTSNWHNAQGSIKP